MLRAAALVPPTALLVLPEADPALDDARAEARAAVATLVGAAARRVVVVSPGRFAGVAGVLHPTLRAAGIPDERSGLGSVVLGVPRAEPTAPTGRPPAAGSAPVPVDDVAAAVGLALLAAAGWTGQVEVLGSGGTEATALRETGRRLAEDDVALLLVGGLSARRGPDAPLAEDPRAAQVDSAIAADLRRLGGPVDPVARGRLADLDPALARDLAISAFAPWQVLLGALDAGAADLRADLRVSVPAGATYAIATWARP